LPDGTESPETSKTKEFFKLVSDLLKNHEFSQTQVISFGLFFLLLLF
jgi:hypothetical protein